MLCLLFTSNVYRLLSLSLVCPQMWNVMEMVINDIWILLHVYLHFLLHSYVVQSSECNTWAGLNCILSCCAAVYWVVCWMPGLCGCAAIYWAVFWILNSRAVRGCSAWYWDVYWIPGLCNWAASFLPFCWFADVCQCWSCCRIFNLFFFFGHL